VIEHDHVTARKPGGCRARLNASERRGGLVSYSIHHHLLDSFLLPLCGATSIYNVPTHFSFENLPPLFRHRHFKTANLYNLDFPPQYKENVDVE
jgi:hypothetical protein